MPLAWRDNCFAHWDTNQEGLAGRESQRATPQSAMPQIVRSIGDLCVRNVQVRLVQAVWLPQMTQFFQSKSKCWTTTNPDLVPV